MVVGVSKDSPKSHDKFKGKYDLKVVLASDEDIKTAEAYGVWVEKSMYGRKYMGMERATFLIDGKGVIRKIWHKVKVPPHLHLVADAYYAQYYGAPKVADIVEGDLHDGASCNYAPPGDHLYSWGQG